MRATGKHFIGTETLKLAGLAESDSCFTPIDARFDRITRIAREALRAQAAGITLLRQTGFWFKSIAGWEIEELPGDRSLCTVVLARQDTVIIPDLAADPECADHPLVVKKPKFRFYAGHPLKSRNGQVLGTFCVFDSRPRHLNRAQLQVFRDLAELAQRELTNHETEFAQRRLVEKLDTARRQAMVDPLTRVWNRRSGLELLDEACRSNGRSSQAVCMVDLDHFKDVNDTHGHQTGDDVLKKVARLIVSSIRDHDIVCRYGGDEFLLILKIGEREDVARITQRIRDTVSEFPVRTRTGEIPMSVTVGAAIITPGASPEEMVERADKALLKAKATRGSGLKPAAKAG